MSEESWNCTANELAEELRLFISEMGSFTPEHFVQIKFHLLRQSGLTIETRDEFCEVSIHHGHCPRCSSLYVAKECLLWFRLFDVVEWKLVRRAPPCIRSAFRKKSIKNVADYLVKANLIHPPFYKIRRAPGCRAMRRWGYCSEDEYCRAMEKDYTLEYIKAREKVKQSR
ncbi:MAG: hypothetical protein JSW61_05330 [Candidatus Thorarchaeota archaeon]|nr:MAG: hypothetical protein JSW61_05330 [Candidatus Thorarchaeota archaeon]